MRFKLLLVLLLYNGVTLSQKLSSQLPAAAVVEVDFAEGIIKDELPVPYLTRVIFKGTIDSSIMSVVAYSADGPFLKLLPRLSSDTLIWVESIIFTESEAK